MISYPYAGFPVSRAILETIGNPDIRDTRCPERPAHGVADFAGTDAVLDPEPANALVAMRKGETADRVRMGEAGGVEVKPETVLAGPADPVLEVPGFDFVAIHFAAAELAVHRVQVHSMFARNERERFVEIHPQFVRRAGLARMVPGDGETATNGSGAVLETGHVVSLPAMKRDGDCRQGFQGPLHVDFE